MEIHQDFSCPVCLEYDENKLSCNHTCCVPCTKKIMKINGLCPICRHDFDKQNYKYKPPMHTPNLKITATQTRTWNRFLNNRYFLTGNKKQRIFAFLMYRYADLLCFRYKYLDLTAMIYRTVTYDTDYLIDCIYWLQNKNKLYSNAMKQYAIFQIRSHLARLR
jgi:hypothetical protein